jgi:hypothetical protein
MGPFVSANHFGRPTSLKGIGLLLLVCLSVTLSGCGVKKPPKPPLHIPPPAITDLRSSLDGKQVTLTWTIERTTQGLRFDYEAFVIYRAKIPAAEAACTTCPYLFIQKAVVPASLPERRFDERLAGEYSESVAPGFRYVYKVVGFATTGDKTADSNLTAVDTF